MRDLAIIIGAFAVALGGSRMLAHFCEPSSMWFWGVTCS